MGETIFLFQRFEYYYYFYIFKASNSFDLRNLKKAENAVTVNSDR